MALTAVNLASAKRVKHASDFQSSKNGMIVLN
ncbi:hypothetical protein TDB9533_04113 [Thalassocella blandensis]|nr:hypothetical protein TDB9533_04113 [Thalassocella blandensis]